MNMNEQQILIKKPFNEQYTLLIETDSRIINTSLKSKTQARYDFSVINVEKNIIECRLIQLDLFVVESNNDLVKEISQVTAAFNRMFNELHLKLNEKGEILEILNMDLILSKWEQTKTEMQEAARANEDIKQLIIINDSLLSQPDKIKIAIKANEFLQVFFGKIYGVNTSFRINEMGTNLLNTANLTWSFSINDIYEQKNSNRIKIISEAEPQYSLNSKFYNSAYQQFEEHIDLSKLSVKLKQNSEYLIDKDTNRVMQAQVNKIENVHPDKLYMKLSYTLMCDKIYAKSLKNNHEIYEDREKEALEKGYNTDFNTMYLVEGSYRIID